MSDLVIPEYTTPTQAAVLLRPGLTSLAGFNENAARTIANHTGEVFEGAIRTFVLMDDEQAFFAAALHSPELSMRMGGPEHRIWISFMSEALPFLRDTVIILAPVIFDDAGAAELATACGPATPPPVGP